MTLEGLITKHQKVLGDLDKTILRYVLDNRPKIQQIVLPKLQRRVFRQLLVVPSNLFGNAGSGLELMAQVHFSLRYMGL